MNIALNPARSRVCLAALAVVAFSGLAAAGECPAGKVKDGAVTTGEMMPKGVTDTVLFDIGTIGTRHFSMNGASANLHMAGTRDAIFGNPALGSQFMTSNPVAGIDWPVRLLVLEDNKGQVWAVYNDFGYIAHRHRIKNRAAAFKMASEVIGSIASAVKAQ